MNASLKSDAMMNAELLYACQLTWSAPRTVSAAEGWCERVLGRPANELLGRPLHEVLAIPEERAALLDARARQDGAFVEFFSARMPGQEPTVFRFACRAEGDQVTASVVDAHAFMTGAPPLQIARLSSSLSHEIRNPLSSVKMAVQTLARNPGHSERDQRRLAIANREIRTMERMLGLLSEYGRDLSPNSEPVPLRAAILDAVAVVEPELGERKIQLKFDEPEELPRVRVDPHRIRLVLAQFLLNVAMGLPEGSELRVTLRAGPGGGARMMVQDPTASVLAEERATLFEPFGSRLARGAGLSLAALRRVMQLQGGDVSAESLADQGALFTLTFPA